MIAVVGTMLKQSSFVKIREAVPISHADKIRKVLSAAGAVYDGEKSG